MNVHENARPTPIGRALMCDRIERCWPVTKAAEAFGVSRRTAGKWLQRHRRGGERRLHDRSSALRRWWMGELVTMSLVELRQRRQLRAFLSATRMQMERQRLHADETLAAIDRIGRLSAPLEEHLERGRAAGGRVERELQRRVSRAVADAAPQIVQIILAARQRY